MVPADLGASKSADPMLLPLYFEIGIDAMMPDIVAISRIGNT
jgi:hypothetical protein